MLLPTVGQVTTGEMRWCLCQDAPLLPPINLQWSPGCCRLCFGGAGGWGGGRKHLGSWLRAGWKSRLTTQKSKCEVSSGLPGPKHLDQPELSSAKETVSEERSNFHCQRDGGTQRQDFGLQKPWEDGSHLGDDLMHFKKETEDSSLSTPCVRAKAQRHAPGREQGLLMEMWLLGRVVVTP